MIQPEWNDASNSLGLGRALILLQKCSLTPSLLLHLCLGEQPGSYTLRETMLKRIVEINHCYDYVLLFCCVIHT